MNTLPSRAERTKDIQDDLDGLMLQHGSGYEQFLKGLVPLILKREDNYAQLKMEEYHRYLLQLTMTNAPAALKDQS